MTDTLSPARTKRGINASIRVVLLLPERPANPRTFMPAGSLPP